MTILTVILLLSMPLQIVIGSFNHQVDSVQHREGLYSSVTKVPKEFMQLYNSSRMNLKLLLTGQTNSAVAFVCPEAFFVVHQVSLFVRHFKDADAEIARYVDVHMNISCYEGGNCSGSAYTYT